MEKNHVIKVKNLIKCYKNGTKALDNFNIQVKKGEVFALLGPNGAGKSTLLDTLSMIKQPTSGTVSVLGKTFSKNVSIFGKTALGGENEIRKKTAYVTQYHSSDDYLSVYDNLDFQLCLYGEKNRRERIHHTVKALHMENILYGDTAKLSGGNRRKLDIAMNIVYAPEILFLDEPTTGLDIDTRMELWQLIKDLNKEGTTVFLTTHYLEEAEYLADTLCIMAKGRNIIQGSLAEIKNQLGQKDINQLYLSVAFSNQSS